jgi:hypothetical protein
MSQQKSLRGSRNKRLDLPKWVSANQARRLHKALKANPELEVNAALLALSREPALTSEG